MHKRGGDFSKSLERAFISKEERHRCRFNRAAVAWILRKRARTSAVLKTAVKPILKSLRSLSLAAQIDVRPCFTFNSIGQKTAIRWRDAALRAPSFSDRRRIVPTIPEPRRLSSIPLGTGATAATCLLFHSCGPPTRCKR